MQDCLSLVSLNQRVLGLGLRVTHGSVAWLAPTCVEVGLEEFAVQRTKYAQPNNGKQLRFVEHMTQSVHFIYLFPCLVKFKRQLQNWKPKTALTATTQY